MQKLNLQDKSLTEKFFGSNSQILKLVWILKIAKERARKEKEWSAQGDSKSLPRLPFFPLFIREKS